MLYAMQLTELERQAYLTADDTILMIVTSFNIRLTKWKAEVQLNPVEPYNAAEYMLHAVRWYEDALPNATAMGYQYPGQEFVRPGRQDAIVSAAVVDNACRFCHMHGHYEANCWQKNPHLKPKGDSKPTVAKPRGPARPNDKRQSNSPRPGAQPKVQVPPAKGTGGRGALTRSGDRKGDKTIIDPCLFCVEVGVPVGKINHLLANCHRYKKVQDKIKSKRTAVLLSVDDDSESDSDEFAFCVGCADDSDSDDDESRCPDLIDDCTDSDSDDDESRCPDLIGDGTDSDSDSASTACYTIADIYACPDFAESDSKFQSISAPTAEFPVPVHTLTSARKFRG